jgi:hypothetical protein
LPLDFFHVQLPQGLPRKIRCRSTLGPWMVTSSIVFGRRMTRILAL